MKTAALLIGTLAGHATATAAQSGGDTQVASPGYVTAESDSHFEVGAFDKINHHQKSINFAGSFGEPPVVFANAITWKGNDPVTTVIEGVTKNSVETIKIQEPKCGGRQELHAESGREDRSEDELLAHTNEQLDWMALPEGVYETGKNQFMKVGTVECIGVNKPVTVDLGNRFTGIPKEDIVVLLAVQTSGEGSDWKIARVVNGNDSINQLTLVVQNAEHYTEDDGIVDDTTTTVGYIALRAGDHFYNGYKFHARVVKSEPGNRVTQKLTGNVGADDPLIFASLGCNNCFTDAANREPAYPRIVKDGNDIGEPGTFKIGVDEDMCKDWERYHPEETIFVVTVDKEQRFHFESGTESALNENAIANINFGTSFGGDVPVLIANAISYNDEAAVTSKIQFVQSNGVFGLKLHEPDCLAYTQNQHAEESMDWLALKEGEYGQTSYYGGIKVGRKMKKGSRTVTQDDGTRIQQTISSLGTMTVTFDTPFPNDDVAVILNVQGDDSDEWKIARAFDVTAEGFKIFVQTQEDEIGEDGEIIVREGVDYKDTTVGWLAVPIGKHRILGHEFHAQKIASQPGQARLDTATMLFSHHTGDEEPRVFTSIGSRNGGDPAFTRVQKVTENGRLSGYKVLVDEEKCKDDAWHVTEDIFVVTMGKQVIAGSNSLNRVVMSEESAQFWANAKPGFGSTQISMKCQPEFCKEWKCPQWCECFEEQKLREMFNSPAFEVELEKKCPEDGGNPCKCE